MSIQYISDIHLELMSPQNVSKFMKQFKPISDVCILAGDIGNPFTESYKNFLKFLNDSFKKVFIIAGNHEYYKNSVEGTKHQLKEVAKPYPNISILDNSYEDYDSYRFIGTTLWTEVTEPQYTINDINNIKSLSVESYNNLHYDCVKFLKESIVPNSIIITHHLPIYALTDPKYKVGFMAKYNQWFNANLDDFIKENSQHIKAWFYGHTHTRSVQKIYDVDFYCNPLGYVDENSYDTVNVVAEIA